MKKFIFSAVAMIAFVGSSVASNEVEVKFNLMKFVEPKMDCKEVQNATIKQAKEVEGMSDKDAKTAGFMMYFWCMGENSKKLTFGIQPSN